MARDSSDGRNQSTVLPSVDLALRGSGARTAATGRGTHLAVGSAFPGFARVGRAVTSKGSKLLFSFAGVCTALSLACADSPGIAEVLGSPEQYAGLAIEVSGVATNLELDSTGTGGFYTLELSGVREPPSSGIRVRSSYLPAPGVAYDVTGRLVLDPNRSEPTPLLMEQLRSTSTEWFIVIGLLIGFVVGAVGFVLVVLAVARSRLTSKTQPATDAKAVDLGDALAEYQARWQPMQPPVRALTQSPTDRRRRKRTTRKPPVELHTKDSAPSSSVTAELEVVEGPDEGRRFPVAASPLYIGREGERDNHIVLTDQTVSMSHATIVRKDDDQSFALINDSQTNRSLVNQSPVEECVLTDGSSIRLGSTVLIFHQGSSNAQPAEGTRRRTNRRRST